MQKSFSILSVLTLATSSLLAATNLDQQMTLQEKQQTGVVNLTLKQKQTLAAWIDNHYTPTSDMQPTHPSQQPGPHAPAQEHALTLSVNSQNGQQLLLSDGSRWQIHPQDVKTSSIWLTPITVGIKRGTDPNYPYIITNISTNQSVRAKQISPAPTP